MKKIYKNNKILFLTLGLGFIIISIIAFLTKIYPFGDITYLQIDFFHQYAPMLGEFFDKAKEGTLFSYSFSLGLGMPYLNNFMNYLASPLNFIILLFKKENMINVLTYLILFKALFASVAMSIYFENKFNKFDLSYVFLSLIYGFSAFFTAYYWNIMWLDSLIVLPILVLGIEKLINENKKVLYIISLSLGLFANFYMGYILSVFSLAYFLLYLLIIKNNESIKYKLNKVKVFTLSSLLSASLILIFIGPLFLSLINISATGDTFPTGQYYYFTFIEFLVKHIGGATSTVLASGATKAPNIYSSIITVYLFILLFLNKKINYKIKSLFLFLTMFITSGFFIHQIDFIFHAFHVPNDLPYRYSFLYTFVLLIGAGLSVSKINELSVKKIIIPFIILFVSLFSLTFFNFDYISNKIIFINMVLLTLIFAIIILNKYNIKHINLLFIPLILFETTYFINHNWDNTYENNFFYNGYEETRNIINYIEDKDESFYRIEKNSHHTLNDPAWLNYKGISIFSSMAYENVAILQNKLGIPGNKVNSYYYKENTPVYDMMFNIKYKIGTYINNDFMDIYHADDGIIVNKNGFNTNLIYYLENKLDNINDKNDPFDIQNEFIEKATKIENTFIKTKYNTENVYNNNYIIDHLTFNKNIDDYLYLYVDNNSVDFVLVGEKIYYFTDDYDYYYNIDNVVVNDFKKMNENHVIIANNTSEIYIGYNNELSLSSYTIDNLKLNQALKIINFPEIKLNKRNHISFVNDKEGPVYTSIPFDNGFKVYSGGKEIKTYKILDSLLGFDLNKEDKEITIKYETPYFLLFSLVNITGVVILIIVIKKERLISL